MDFLDPKKQRRHAVLLYVGYVFIGIAVLISTLVLVYQANGFGVNSKGELVQNGLVFISTQPNPANIYLNGKINEVQTNSRLSLPSGSYGVRLARDGYRDWTRTINVQGGDVQNFVYPFLFPKDLITKQEAQYATQPSLSTQSRDRRWLVVQPKTAAGNFTVYDLNEDTLQPENISLPANVVTAADGPETWEAVQWANDNDNVLLKHVYGSGYEYILLRRSKPAESVNLTKTLGVNPTKLTLIDNKFDQYHVLVDGTLSASRLAAPALQTLLKNVIEYKSFGTKMIVYASNAASTPQKTTIAVLDDGRDYTLREVVKSDVYSLDTASYRSEQYVVVAASNEPRAYVYKNPVQQLRRAEVLKPTADRAIRVQGVTHVSFSPNMQYILAQNGQSFGVYDLYLGRAYPYITKLPLDAPQQHAEWMDGNHLTYISGGKQIVFDYDRRNQQTLQAALPASGAFFSQDYQYVFSFESDQAGAVTLNRTNLRTSTDL